MTQRDKNYDPYKYGMVDLDQNGEPVSPQGATGSDDVQPDEEDILFGDGAPAAEPMPDTVVSLPGLEIDGHGAEEAREVEADGDETEEEDSLAEPGHAGGLAITLALETDDEHLDVEVDLSPRAGVAEYSLDEDELNEDEGPVELVCEPAVSAPRSDEPVPAPSGVYNHDEDILDLADEPLIADESPNLADEPMPSLRSAPRTELSMADNVETTSVRQRRLKNGSSLQVKVQRRCRKRQAGAASWFLATLILASGVGGGLALMLIGQSLVLGSLVLGLGLVGSMFSAVLMR